MIVCFYPETMNMVSKIMLPQYEMKQKKLEMLIENFFERTGPSSDLQPETFTLKCKPKKATKLKFHH